MRSACSRTSSGSSSARASPAKRSPSATTWRRACRGWPAGRRGASRTTSSSAGRSPTVRELVSSSPDTSTVPEPQGGLPVRVEDGRVYGRGASDMKAGDAVMLALLERLLVGRSWAEPLFLRAGGGTIRGERPRARLRGGSRCTRRGPRPGSGADGGGARGRVRRHGAGRGYLQGSSAHSARPWQGENAITAAASFLARCTKGRWRRSSWRD